MTHQVTQPELERECPPDALNWNFRVRSGFLKCFVKLMHIYDSPRTADHMAHLREAGRFRRGVFTRLWRNKSLAPSVKEFVRNNPSQRSLHKEAAFADTNYLRSWNGKHEFQEIPI